MRPTMAPTPDGAAHRHSFGTCDEVFGDQVIATASHRRALLACAHRLPPETVDPHVVAG